MANIATDAILTRVREVCEGTVAITGREIDSARFTGEYGINEDRAEMTRRAMVIPRYDVRIESVEAHPAQPPTLTTLLLYKVMLSVKVIRHFQHVHLLSDTLRDDVLALAIQDGDVLGQAFHVPTVCNTTVNGDSTGIISGLLRHESTTIGELSMTPGQEPYFIETLHSFSCAVQVSQTSIG